MREQAYDRMIDAVTAAEEYIAQGQQAVPGQDRSPGKAGQRPPTSRRCCAALSRWTRGRAGIDRMISDFRTSDAILEFLASSKLEELAARGVSTPDLSIRIKTGPMPVPAPDAAQAGRVQGRASRPRGKVC